MPENLPTIISLWVAVTVGGSLVLRLLAAPYFIWREDQRTIEEQKEKIARPERAMWERVHHRLADDRFQLTEDLILIRQLISRKNADFSRLLREIEALEIRSAKFRVDDSFDVLWSAFYDASMKFTSSRPIGSKHDTLEEIGEASLLHFDKYGPALEQSVDDLIKYLVVRS